MLITFESVGSFLMNPEKFSCSLITFSFVRRNLDFYAEISEATVKNDNKQQKNNSYGKGKVSKNKVNPD